jgi:hypothetical protein
MGLNDISFRSTFEMPCAEIVMVEPNDNAVWPQLPPIHLVLRELAERESGVGFIYSSLKLLAQRYGLNDVAVVLVSSSVSTRVFRLDGRDTDTNVVAALGTNPGVYCLPDIVPQSELEAIYSTCQEAYSYRFVRNVPSVDKLDTYDLSTLNSALFTEPVLDAAPLENVTSAVRRVRPVSQKESSARARSARINISRILVLIDVVLFVLTAAGIHGPLRLVCGLVLGVVIPGWCIVAPLKLDNPPLELGLTLTVSLSLFILLAQILETLNLWHLVAFEEITCAVCLPFLLHQAKLVTVWSRVLAPKPPPRHTNSRS